MLDLKEYEALRLLPEGTSVMSQRWRDLLFLHFSAPVEEVQSLVPPGLTVDTFPDSRGNERAWVGLVPFRMEGVRPGGLPALPWLSAFPETNVRTYVHRDGKRPGVWFFSLDAARRIACMIGRSWFGLNYIHARMETLRSGDHLEYQSSRRDGELRIQAEAGAPKPEVRPGTIEFFLVERYLLYAVKQGVLFDGQVHHVPYSLRSANLAECDETLISAAGVQSQPWELAWFSDGVDVEVFGLRKCQR